MTSITINVTDDAVERLRQKAASRGRASVEELVGELAEQEAERGDDLDPAEQARIQRFHGLIEEGFSSPRRRLDREQFDQMRDQLRLEFDEDGKPKGDVRQAVRD